MKKLILLISFSFFVFISTNYVNAETSVLTGHKIIIDAGHGGSDSGSTECAGYPEKQANLEIATALRSMLESNTDVTVYMTRETDTPLTNADRYNYANNTDDGEVLLSIHLNGSTDHNKDGTLGLYGKRNKDKSFTEIMHTAMWEGLKTTPEFIDYGVTNFASGVLLKSTMPATIQETVFISDTDECTALKAGTRQQEIAETLYQGLENWFAQSGGGGGDDDGGGRKCYTPPCDKNK